MWFTELARHENPGRKELNQFLDNINKFLDFVLKSPEFQFLWEGEPELRGLAIETFQSDVVESILLLQQEIPNIEENRLRQHGLLGRPVKFKFRVLDSIGRQWNRVREQFSVREWLKQIFEAIDAILDSVIHAAAGAGGLIKEFKDALAALVKTTRRNARGQFS
jgi:hypothetical protein